MPVNIGNPDHEVTMYDLAEACIRLTGSKSQIVYEALPVDDPRERRPDITRAREILGWKPEVGLDEGLRRWIAALGREPVSA
jgi:nucleoside-diphosphate-sugar epimerase